MRTSFSAPACSFSRKPPSRGGALARLLQRRRQRRQLARERRGGGHAVLANGSSASRTQLGIGGERLHRGELGGERIAALDRGS